MKTKIIYILISFIFIISCTSKENIQRIERAQNILEIYPDSAILLLHSIKYPKSLNTKYYMKYSVLNVLAKYKTYQDIKDDTIVFQAAFYLSRQNDLEDKALANYAAASVMRERENRKEAMDYFKKTEKILEQTNNNVLKGLVSENIAFLYDNEMLFDEAIRYYNQALEAYSKNPETIKKSINCLTSLGSDYLCKQKTDSALICYNNAYSISTRINDIDSQPALLNNIGLVYKEKGEYQQSLNYFKKAISIQPIIEEKYRYTMNLSSIYLLINKMDSAKMYIEELENSIDTSDDLTYKAAVTNFLKDFYKKNHSYEKSFEYFEKNKKIYYQIFEENQSKELIEANKKFNYTFFQLKVEKAKLSKRNILIVSCTIFFLLIIIFIYIRNNFKRKELIGESQRKELEFIQASQEVKNKNLQNELVQFKFINTTLHKVLINTNVLHKEINEIVQAGIVQEKSERHQKIQLKLKETQKMVNENIVENVETFLKDKNLLDMNILSYLTEEEKIILAMLFFNETRKDIAAILSISSQAIYNRIPRLKKKLIDLGLDQETIDLFFKNELSSQN